MRTVLSLACLLWFGSTALAAEPRTLRLGRMELVYDAERWIAERSNDNLVTMRPIGAIAEMHGPVSVSRKPSDGIDRCERLARIELPEWLYEEPTSQAVEVAGLAALRFVAYTRCHNATPQGVVICIHNRGSAFLLTMDLVNCNSRAGSRTDPLQELIGGIRFPCSPIRNWRGGYSAAVMVRPASTGKRPAALQLYRHSRRPSGPLARV